MNPIEEQLLGLLFAYQDEFDSYAWKFESDRWVELLIAMLGRVAPSLSVRTREGLEMLDSFGILAPERLASLSEDTAISEDAVLIRAVLKQHGFTRAEVDQAVTVLARTADSIQNAYGGRLQRFLRKHGIAMVEELQSAFRETGLPSEDVRYAVTLWLQSVLSMPLSLNSPVTQRFCERNGVQMSDLLAAADHLNLNVAILDDLIALEEPTLAPDETAQASPREDSGMGGKDVSA